jgi:DNA polymerase-3 subunit gamma/tau
VTTAPLVLARKYRPRNFAQMVGQDHVVRALGHALSSGRLHHAYLFTGTRGIGKTTISRILAKSLNCTGPDGSGGVTATPCGVCQSCVEIDQDRYIDYVELDAASNRGIDEARDLIERAAYKPGVGRFKVFMIDEAHQLTKDAFSALLKTLEEPPDYLKFVLATTDPERMLPTVLSRCLQFNLRPMPPDTVRDHLREVLAAENVACDDAALRLLSRAARGSMRDALSLTDQAIAFGGGQIEEGTVRTMLGAVDRSHAAGIVEALARRDGPAVLGRVDALRLQGLSPVGTLDEIARLLQQMAVEQAVPGALDASDPDTEAPRRLSNAMPADEIQLVYSIALNGRAELGLMSDEYGALTMVLLRVFAFAGDDGGGAQAGGAGSAGGHARQAAAGPRASAHGAAAATGERSSAPGAGAAPRTPDPAAGARAEAALRVSAEAARTAVPAGRRASPPQAPPAPPAAALPKAQAAPIRTAPPTRPAVQVDNEASPPPWADMALPDDDSDGSGGSGPESLPARAAEDPREAPSADRPATVRGAAAAAPASAPAAAAFQPTELGESWARTVSDMVGAGLIGALVREAAMQGELVAVDKTDTEAETWQLRIEREPLRTPALIDKLQAALASHLGRRLRLTIGAGPARDSPALRDAAAREQAQRAAESAIRDDPAVQALLNRFPTARIVPGSIRPV